MNISFCSVEVFTLEFNDGQSLKVPKATLSLCGEMFQSLFQNEFQENQTRKIKLELISSAAFRVILRKVETGILDIQIDKAEFANACDFLSFSCLPDMAFGKEKWEKYLGDVGEQPPLPQNIDEILEADCPFFPGKKVSETHMLTLIPATVNGKPFCLDLLGELIQHPKEGYATKYRYCEAGIEHGQTSPHKSYWVLFPKDVIPGSIGKTRLKQLEMAFCETDYYPPKLLEAATAILMHYVSSGERLLSNVYTCCQEEMGILTDPWMYTSCPDQIYKGSIGRFSGEGLVIVNCEDESERVGVAPLRKF